MIHGANDKPAAASVRAAGATRKARIAVALRKANAAAQGTVLKGARRGSGLEDLRGAGKRCRRRNRYRCST
jgi:hypothetical protein